MGINMHRLCEMYAIGHGQVDLPLPSIRATTDSRRQIILLIDLFLFLLLLLFLFLFFESLLQPLQNRPCDGEIRVCRFKRETHGISPTLAARRARRSSRVSEGKLAINRQEQKRGNKTHTRVCRWTSHASTHPSSSESGASSPFSSASESLSGRE
jgi:hypothetical protein